MNVNLGTRLRRGDQVVVTVCLDAVSKARSTVGFSCSKATAIMQTVNVKKNITRAEFAKTVLICTMSINS
jgi:hypothetical protein